MAATLTALMAHGAHWSVLDAHPATPAAQPAMISTEARLAAPAVLVCDYVLHTDTSGVRLPRAHGGQRQEGLWQHTCFEAFVAAPGVAGYYEFNFSPALDWAAYYFLDYRCGMTAALLVEPPALAVHLSATRLELSARVELAGLPDVAEAAPLKLALAAVIEEQGGRLSYWALQHAPGKPDFHHPEAFALELHAP